jgi:hypothetical protein
MKLTHYEQLVKAETKEKGQDGHSISVTKLHCAAPGKASRGADFSW